MFIFEYAQNMPSISYPELNEMLQSLFKLLKKNNEIPLRIAALRVFKYLIREQATVNINNKTETFKFITKFIVSVAASERKIC